MGMTSFICETDAPSAAQGFNALCGEAVREYGDYYFNGTISTTGFLGLFNGAKTYAMTESTLKEARAMAEQQLGNIKKRDCYAVDAGVVSYNIVSFDKVEGTRATARYRVRYVVYGGDDVIGEFEKLTDAKRCLKEALKSPNVDCESYEIRKESRKVTESSSNVEAKYVRNVKQAKTMPKSIPNGAWVYPVHRYVYYGYAAC